MELAQAMTPDSPGLDASITRVLRGEGGDDGALGRETGDLEGVYRGQWRSEGEQWLKGRVCHVTEPLSKTSRVNPGVSTLRCVDTTR